MQSEKSKEVKFQNHLRNDCCQYFVGPGPMYVKIQDKLLHGFILKLYPVD